MLQSIQMLEYSFFKICIPEYFSACGLIHLLLPDFLMSLLLQLGIQSDLPYL